MLRRWGLPIVIGVVLGAIAWHVTLAAVPRGLMVIAERRIARMGAPANRMAHGPIVTAQSRAVVRPSPDLLYSTCVFDVGDRPVLIDAEPISAPYWSLSVFDHATNVAFVRNNQQSRGQAIRIAILRDGQSAPAGYEPVKVGGRQGVALIRILIDRTRPINAIDTDRHRSSCRTA